MRRRKRGFWGSIGYFLWKVGTFALLALITIIIVKDSTFTYKYNPKRARVTMQSKSMMSRVSDSVEGLLSVARIF